MFFVTCAHRVRGTVAHALCQGLDRQRAALLPGRRSGQPEMVVG